MNNPSTANPTNPLPKAIIPSKVDSHSPTEILFEWNSGERYSLPYLDLRFECPCAGCVDEHTGARTIKRASIASSIKPKSAHPVGQYALQINWNDGHSTGMYHFDRLYELCQKQGKRLTKG